MAYFEGNGMTGGYGNGPDIINSCTVNVNKGEIEIASFVNLTLSCDHRAVDGVLASQFLSSIVSNLEKINNDK